MVDLMLLPDRARVLPDPVGLDLELGRGPLLPDRFGLHGHGAAV
jgi:hypothetical protein